jgi:hypothetical protein
MAENTGRVLRIKSIDGDTRFQNVKLKIKENLILFLIFFIDEDHHGKHMISEAAQTRLQNIKKNDWYDDEKYKAHCIPIQSVDEIIEQTSAIIKKNKDKNVLIQEMGVFSHAGGDGPISYKKKVVVFPEPKYKSQMLMQGWQLINVKWMKGAKFVFYGCNTGSTNSLQYKNFAENISKLSNFKDVEVWGQSKSSFPSFYPDYRVTSAARSIDGKHSKELIENGLGWDLRGKTYQVGGNSGEGNKAISYRPDKDTLSKEALKEGEYPKAEPMNCYKNGTPIKSSHQGVFNDHR